MIQKLVIGIITIVAALFIWAQIQNFWNATVARPKDTDPTVRETLRAPFADEAVKSEIVVKSGDPPRLPENQIAMDQPHRASFQIEEWIVTSVSEAMSFDAETDHDDAEKEEGHFSPTGLQQYLAFLQEAGLKNLLSEKTYIIRTVVQETPFLVTEGAVDGSYRWLYEMPVMVTILDKDSTNYKEVVPQNKKMIIKVQVGRSRTTDDPAGLRIERWSWRSSK